jgi:hypothetical protein
LSFRLRYVPQLRPTVSNVLQYQMLPKYGEFGIGEGVASAAL